MRTTRHQKVVYQNLSRIRIMRHPKLVYHNRSRIKTIRRQTVVYHDQFRTRSIRNKKVVYHNQFTTQTIRNLKVSNQDLIMHVKWSIMRIYISSLMHAPAEIKRTYIAHKNYVASTTSSQKAVRQRQQGKALVQRAQRNACKKPSILKKKGIEQVELWTEGHRVAELFDSLGKAIGA